MKSLILALRTVFYLLLASCAFVWCSMNYFGYTRPTKPIPAEGRVYSYQDHYTVVYLTRREHLLIDFRTWVGLLVLTLATGTATQRLDNYAKTKLRH